MNFKSITTLLVILSVTSFANAYLFQGLDVEVDYWSGEGSNETIIVVDWNAANGPYSTESHAFGYRWDGSSVNLGSALSVIDAGGDFNITIPESGFISGINYNDGVEIHTQTSDDWTWLGDTTNAGDIWTGNAGGVFAEMLVNGNIEGLNINYLDWTGSNLDIPIVPEPATLALFGIGSMVFMRKRSA